MKHIIKKMVFLRHNTSVIFFLCTWGGEFQALHAYAQKLE